MGQPPKRPPTLPGHIQHVIATPLTENQVGLFRSNLADYISPGYVPSTELIQTLIYLSLSPSVEQLGPEPIYLLHRILASHTPSHFADSLPTPVRGEPGWKYWHHGANHNVGKATVKMMSKCREGIWDILWAQRAEDQDRRVGDAAWEVIGWLVEVWEKDQEDYAVPHPDEQMYSPMFISQLSGPSADLVPDNASPILDVVRGAFAPSESKIGKHQRIDLAARLLSLLVNAANHRPPTFHPPSLILSFLTLLRSTLSPQETSTFLSYLHTKIPPDIMSHVYAIGIEDLAGVRVSRATARKTAKTNGRTVREFEDRRPFPPPTMSFLLGDLLCLRASERRESRMGIIKLALTGLMISLRPPTEWTEAISTLVSDWLEQIGAVVLSDGKDATDVANGMALMALLQSLSADPPTLSPPPLPSSLPLSQTVPWPAPPVFSPPPLPTSPPQSQRPT